VLLTKYSTFGGGGEGGDGEVGRDKLGVASGERRNACMILVGRRKGRSLLGKLRRRWDILQLNHKGGGREDVDWTNVAAEKTILNLGYIIL